MDFKCQHCGRCCADPSLIVTLTHRDLLRFEFFLPDTDLFQIVTFYQIQDDDKILEERLMSSAVITNQGKVILGLSKKNTKCLFLKDNICQIYESRPQICHCFPYTFQTRRNHIYWGYSLKAKEFCPAIQKEEKINTTILEELASQILEESKEFKQLIYIWNHLAKNKIIVPTPNLLLQFITGKIELTLENIKKL